MRFVTPPWTAPGGVLHEQVGAASTTRHGGASHAPYDSFNLAQHVGDDPQAVAANRRRLADWLELPAAPRWLQQVHGTRVIEAGDWHAGIEADASIARVRGVVLAVMTADCLPLLLAAADGAAVAAVHAGWRGLAAGIIERTLEQLAVAPGDVLAWIGPAISQPAFEVGDEVRDAFVADDHLAVNCFAPNAQARWQADLKMLATLRLRRAGVRRITDRGHCTFRQPEDYFSYRRAHPCGRMASLIWLR